MSACAQTCQIHPGGTSSGQKLIFGVAYTKGTIKIEFKGGAGFSHTIITPTDRQPYLVVYFKPPSPGYYNTKAIFRLYDKQGKFHMKHIVKITGTGLFHKKDGPGPETPPPGLPNISGVCYVLDPKFKVSGKAQVVKDKERISIGYALSLASGMYLFLRKESRDKKKVWIGDTSHPALIKNIQKIPAIDPENPVTPSTKGFLIKVDPSFAAKVGVYDVGTFTFYNLYRIGRDTKGFHYFLFVPPVKKVAQPYVVLFRRDGKIKAREAKLTEIFAKVPNILPSGIEVWGEFDVRAPENTYVKIKFWGNLEKITKVEGRGIKVISWNNNSVYAKLIQDTGNIIVHFLTGSHEKGLIHYTAEILKLGKCKELKQDEKWRIRKLAGIP
jgi:hypothetical protein